ncbi:MAG: GNAT family N-acetyltransferase [Rhodospirillales bacterium]|nr:GNAT family N-acetyltransferase [Rhodospirillales bacterium]
MVTVTASPIEPGGTAAWEALAQRWRVLESEADGSFFTSWTWIGCLASERFDAPLLVAADAAGETVALALFNRRRRWIGRSRLWLHEAGRRALDTPFIEHNGVLTRDPALIADCLRAALRHGHLVLSGVEEPTLLAARATGKAWRRQEPRPAPWVDLRRVRSSGGIAPLLSANARQQLRRARRALETGGPLRLARAADPAEALAFLREMAGLHQASWQARGQPGAFSEPFFVRFHETLLARALPRGEAELLRITAGPRVLGLLYNFVHKGRVLAYQSGFAGAAAGPSIGQVCHWLAIEEHAAAGRNVYDFLAGEARYKTRFATDVMDMHWLDLER